MVLGKRWLWFLALVLGSAVLVVSCAPAATPTPAPPAVVPIAPAPAGTVFNYAELLTAAFPPGPGRDLVVSTCLNCHGVGVIVMSGSQKDAAAWAFHRSYHQVAMVPWLTQAERDQVWGYLANTFGPTKPAPVLPASVALFFYSWADQRD